MTQEEKINLLDKIRQDYAFPGTPSFDVLTIAPEMVNCLDSLVSLSDTEPFDIAAALGV